MAQLEESKLELEELRRRERELAALAEIAGELSGSLHDSDQVLRLIVKRARRLLGADLAYISVPEEDGVRAKVRVVDGHITPAFADLRLTLGTGLGGVVASTRMPYASRDTRADPGVVHDEEFISGIAREEGIVAVVGAPLIRGRVIGVLYAAQRSPRSFSRSEIALLSALADHAVVALNNAYLFEEAEASIVELQRVRDELAAQSAASERLAELDDALIEAMLEEETVERLTATLAEFTGAAAAILDDGGRLLAVGGKEPGRSALAAAAAKLPVPASEGEVTLPGGGSAIVAAVGGGGGDRRGTRSQHSDPEYRGAVVCARGGDAAAAERALAARAALIARLLLARLQDLARSRRETRNELVYELLAERRDEADLRRRARAAELDLDRPHVLAVLAAGPTEAEQAKLARRARNLAVHHGGLVAEHQGRTVLIVSAGAAAALTSGESGATGAVSQPFEGPLTVRDAWRRTARALEALLALGRAGEVVAAAELGFLGLLLPQLESGEAVAFAAAWLAPLREHDERRGTELVDTVEAYLDCSGNVTETARRIGVHPNTVYKRLGRIEELLGPGWSAAEPALQLQLAIRILRIAGPASRSRRA